jgi:methylase of polypeptide subunit release factors
MEGYDASTYGERWAEIYDEWVERAGMVQGPDQIVPVLAELAGTGPALELAIGTGRIALPLAQRGVEVHGIDASPAMVSRLREKPGGDGIPVVMGNFADVPVDGRFRLIYVVFNTLFALSTQEAQIRCFEGVALHLSDDGVFVIEAFVPDVARFDRGQRVQATEVGTDGAQIEVSLHDQAAQRVDSMMITVREAGLRLFPVHLRYAWPAELDLMARLAGLQLRDRWDGWDRTPFTGSAGRHVSVYERAGS